MKRKTSFIGAVYSVSVFMLFLYRSAIFDKFMSNVRRSSWRVGADSHLARLFESDPKFYLDSAFIWHRTPEGADFWQKINAAWADYRKAYDIR